MTESCLVWLVCGLLVRPCTTDASTTASATTSPAVTSPNSDDAQTDPSPSGLTTSHTIRVGSRDRAYRLHVPPALKPNVRVPLVICLHGGGQSGQRTESFTGFNRVADREGFLVAYPDAVGRNWNDGRDAPQIRSQREGVDDVGFIAALIDELVKTRGADPRRIYATGASNGAFMSHRLAIELPHKIAAIAPVIGGIAEPLAERFQPARPVSVLIIQGTDDPLVPYNGGAVGGPGGRGRLIATEAAVRKWVSHNGCKDPPIGSDLPDTAPADGCRVKVLRYTGGKAGTEVVLYRIEGGGHTWPGGPQYLPEAWIGKVCRDFDGAAVIWEFFKGHTLHE